MLLYGASVARAVAQGLELVGELNGRVDIREGDPLPGVENRSVMRLGARYTRGAVRIDGAVLSGLTSRDPSFGVTAGFTWVFEAFQIRRTHPESQARTNPDPEPMDIIKAHAYGNDFLFVSEDQVGGRDPAALARAACARHTGVGADGLIFYRHTPWGAAMKLFQLGWERRRGVGQCGSVLGGDCLTGYAHRVMPTSRLRPRASTRAAGWRARCH